jgi:basic membrane protein A
MKKLALALFATMFATAVSAAEIKPAVVYDLGGKFDKSFNEGVFNGAEKFKAETGIEFREFETQNASQYEQALAKFAEDGNNPVLAVGFSQEAALKKVAADFPETSFAIIDAAVDLPNVQSILFKEHEGSFLVGLLAAKASQTAKVGFIGGMDIGLIRRFGCGYVQGAKYANPDIEVFQNMTGTTPTAWNDPVKGGELAASQIGRGADVVYAAAGATGIGVLQKTADLGKLGIGVDSNQNHLHPGKVLTSMLKRVDVATYNTFMAAKDGAWKPGISVLGLAEDGVGWADDENNKPLITEEMRAAVEKAKADIVSGAITVHDYMSDNTCPM